MPSEGPGRKVELQNTEMEDILGRVPGWITRNGIILFSFLLLLLLFGSWVFKYPDVKRARIVVTSMNPAADLKARTSGKIIELLVNDNELVENGQILAMIENPASFDDVIELKSHLALMDSVPVDELSADMPELRNARLGTIQGDYSIFLKVYRA